MTFRHDNGWIQYKGWIDKTLLDFGRVWLYECVHPGCRSAVRGDKNDGVTALLYEAQHVHEKQGRMPWCPG